MVPKKRKRGKTALEKMSHKQLLVSLRKDLHTLVLEAEGATVQKRKKRKR